MSSSILTKKQWKILEFLKSFHEKKGYPPSLKEISKHFSIAIPTAQGHLKSLIINGAIGRNPHKARSIIFKQEKPRNMTVSVPLLGTISAGEGILLYEDENPQLVEAPSEMTTSGYNHYALKVVGFSMVGDGIMDGDTIIVRQQATAEIGDPVVAILKDGFDEKATLKRFYPKGDEIELRSKNPSLNSIKLKRNQLEIRGKFVGLLRRD
ncbi:MAG: lexA [Candidatus Levybacteria bacterium]|nr:lexA [Candidatus Levybacteria bacterium]